MKNLIEELRNDERGPQDTLVDNNPHYKELQPLQFSNETELLESLSEEQKEKLEKYCDTTLEMSPYPNAKHLPRDSESPCGWRALRLRIRQMNNAQLVIDEVKKAVKGKDDCIIKAFAAFLAGGHILLEDVPGVGKTTLAVAFSRAMALVNHRVQFTPDVLPADILGFSMYQKQTGEFVYREGAVMCNLFLADEINRTSPKTQSALLEVMEEGNVTVDGTSRKVPEPFIVMATQNPKGSAGTQLLPESQLDRFMICMSMGYPSHDAEVDIAKGKSVKADEYTIKPVMNAQGLVEMQGEVEQVFIHDSIYSYIVDLVDATRTSPYIELGVSPRGTIACVRMAKAYAYLSGRSYVIPSDVVSVFADVTKHRIVLNTKARVSHVSELSVIDEILKAVKQPTTYVKKAGNRD